MFKSKWITAACAACLFTAGFGVRAFLEEPVAHAQGSTRVFEMRTYTANPGKFEALKTRFRDHTLKLFERHGMTNIGYWIPADGEKSQNTLVYILAYPSREAAKKSWAAFTADPEWQKVRTESQKDGTILVGPPESVFLNPADFSAIK